MALITQQPARPHNPNRNTNDSGPAANPNPNATFGGGDEAHDLGCGVAPQATTLIVTVDYDTLSGQLKSAGFIDGTPIDIDDLRRIACDAGVVPGIFAADGQTLYLGTKQRSATHAQRLALYARDKHCIGCGMRASACDAHHIIWWEHSGPTGITNLVLLCPDCHRKVHKHGYTVSQDSTGRHRLKPPAHARDHIRDKASARDPTRTQTPSKPSPSKPIHGRNRLHPTLSKHAGSCPPPPPPPPTTLLAWLIPGR